MSADNLDAHISQIATIWTVLDAAHKGPAEQAKSAKEQLLKLYTPAVYRYLVGALHDKDAADDVFQEFALKFVRGDCKNADRDRGQFRHFLKSMLYRLVIDYHRRQKKRTAPLSPELADQVSEPEPLPADDAEFLANWRRQLMSLSWEALAREERTTGQPFHTVLRFRADHPEMRAEQIARELGPCLRMEVSPEWIRKRLHLARKRFTELLLDEIARTMSSPTLDELTQEVIDLGLLEYCHGALEQRRGS